MELRCSRLAATVDAQAGGRLAQFWVDGVPCLVDDPTLGPIYWGSPPMVPWAGRVRNAVMHIGDRTITLQPLSPPNAIHGVGFLQPWEVVESTPASVELRCALDWELGGVAGQRIALREDTLRCEMWVTAEGERMPATIGWHPWFLRPAEVDATFTAMYERGPDHLPTGALIRPRPLPWDDCFVLAEHPPRVRLAHAVIELTSDCTHWVVYTEPEHAVCVEPQSGPPDAVRLGLSTWLEPGQTLRRWMEWRIAVWPAAHDDR